MLQVKYGERYLRMSDAFHDFERHGVPDRDLTMDYSFWVVRQGERVALVDTGYDVGEREWLGEVSVMPPPDGLAKLGIDPADVELLVLTHFHFDHIGYVHLFTRATIVCSRLEWDYWMAKKRSGSLDGEFTTDAMLQQIEDAAAEGRVTLIDDETEVMPGVTAIPLGGHCPGELIVTVESDGRGLILTADAAHYGMQIEHGWPFFAYTDLDDMLAGLEAIRQLGESTGWDVVPGHDPAVREKYPSRDVDGLVSVLMTADPAQPV